MGRHFVISDIHGMYNIYEKVCEILEPEDIVYFLGDAGDRGYDGFRCIKEIYENPQWIYLKGNHELMMSKGLISLSDGLIDDFDFTLWMSNGGYDTYEGWSAAGSDYNWAYKLKDLPLTTEYTNSKGITFHMSHAGYTCGRVEEMWGDELVWNRDHFLDYWDEDKFSNDICVHGHTPIEYLIEDFTWKNHSEIGKWDKKKAQIIKYTNDHKWDIDNGVFYTGRTVLYDMDNDLTYELTDDNFFEEDGE